MSYGTTFNSKKSAPWWKSDIAELRKVAITALRRYKHAGRRAGMIDRAAEFDHYKRAKKQLTVIIQKAQKDSKQELCNYVDNDVWGVLYKLVMKRLGQQPPAMNVEVVTEIARGVLPVLPDIDCDFTPLPMDLRMDLLLTSTDSIPLFAETELSHAIDKLTTVKYSGPNLVLNEIIKLTAARRPDIFLKNVNECLSEGQFSDISRRAKLILLHKGSDEPLDLPSSYRPIGLQDGARMVLKRLLLNGLQKHIDEIDVIRVAQFGFRRSHSTTDTVEGVLQIAPTASRGASQYRHLCAIVSLIVINAINLVPWNLIVSARQMSSVPTYNVTIIGSYMKNRWIEIGHNSGQNRPKLVLSCDVPRGLALGPTLWILFYDGLLHLTVRNNIRLIPFMNDVALVMMAHNADLLDQIINSVLSNIENRMFENDLSLDPTKSDYVILRKKYAYRNPVLVLNHCGDYHELEGSHRVRDSKKCTSLANLLNSQVYNLIKLIKFL